MEDSGENPRVFEAEGPNSKLTWKIGTGISVTLGILAIVAPLNGGKSLAIFFFLGIASIFYCSHLYERNRKVLLYEDRIVFVKSSNQVLLDAPFGVIVKLHVLRSRGSIMRYEVSTSNGKRNGFGAFTESAQDLVKAIESKTGMKFS